MTWPIFPTTLALSLNDLAFYGFILLFVVIPWITKAIKQAGGKTNPNQTPPQQSPQKTRQLRADRRDLDKLARLRRDAISGRQAGPSSTEPTNLTMAQRTERASAQAVYQQRVDQLRQQSPALRPTGDHTATTTPSKKPAPLQESRKAQTHRQQVTRYKRNVDRQPGPDTIGPNKPKKRSRLGSLDSQELRRAILLKEIFDPPIALRDSATDSSGNGI